MWWRCMEIFICSLVHLAYCVFAHARTVLVYPSVAHCGFAVSEQVEERLKFYDTGEAPRKNVSVMEKVAAEIAREGGEIAQVSTPSSQKKKKKKRERKEGDEAVAAVDDAPSSKKKKKKKKASE